MSTLHKNILFALVLLLFHPLLSRAMERPNVLFIVIDDLGYGDLSCMGLSNDVHTPNMDQLAAEGTRFTQAYVTAPICNASRVSLITGCYQQRQGVYWYGGNGLSDSKIPTLAELLKAAGYATGYVGKFHHGSTDHPDGRGFPLNHGFDSFYGFAGGTKHYLHHKRSYQKQKDMLHQGPMWVQREQIDAEGFTTELFGEEARAFIRAHTKEPFYLHLSFNAVHNFTHQLPEAYLKEKGLNGFPDQAPGEDYWAWRKKISFPAHAEGRDYYLGQLHLLDLEIGRVMDALKKQKLDQKTVVILVSDNGGSLVTYAKNGLLKGGKYTLFEGGTRVPLIMYYPRKTAQRKVSEALTSTMDIFPTICELTGVDSPKNLDGTSLMPIVMGGSSDRDRTLFWDTGHERAIRRGKWKLLHTATAPTPRLQITDTPKGLFLFDLNTDPGEQKDLAGAYPEVLRELKAALTAWQTNVKPVK